MTSLKAHRKGTKHAKKNKDSVVATRKQNEERFPSWKPLLDGGREYWREVRGHRGWWARYVKVVDASERTVHFRQEIYDTEGELIELHEKYPVNRGHRKVKEDRL